MLFARPLLAALSFAMAIPAIAQQTACRERTIPVSIYNKNGNPAPELTPGSLSGTLGNKPVTIRTVRHLEKPPQIILLVDTSASLAVRAEDEINVAEGVVLRMPAEVSVGLAFFAKDLLPVASPTADHNGVTVELEALRWDRRSYRGKTAIWTAIQDTVKMFGKPLPGDAIYLISDGVDTASSDKLKEVEGMISAAGIRLFVFLDSDIPPGSSPVGGIGIDWVPQFAKFTGGTVISVSPPGGPFSALPFRVGLVDNKGKATPVGLALDSQMDLLLHYSSVEIELPESPDKPREWKLEFSHTEKSQKDLVLTYPTLLAPCH
jgi:hypothetical protein